MANLRAQSPDYLTNVVSSEQHAAPALGRDLWVALAEVPVTAKGATQFNVLYVTSTKRTTVKFGLSGSTGARSFPIEPLKVLTFKIPDNLIITSSGIVEHKALHVWSDDADLSAYLLCGDTVLADGTYVIPTTGWGNDYVVASYVSLFESSYDYPSEFTMVANQDSTFAEITPSWDFRASGQPLVVQHPRNKPFLETLSGGYCVRYQLTEAQNPDDYDVTGSLVNSNKPVGITGISEGSNVPPDYPYFGYLCDMTPPIRSWGKTYYSTPFALRTGGDSYLVIASSDGQTIYRSDASSGEHRFAILNKYQYLRDPSIDISTKYYSDKPFLLAQYENSVTWPGTGPSNTKAGDPFMVVLNSVEQFSKSLVVQAPNIPTVQGNFQNYLNVIIPSASVDSTTFDSSPIKSSNATRSVIDGTYEVWRLQNVTPGAHTLRCTAPIGSYGYGYGNFASYSWSSGLGTSTLNSRDSLAPKVAISSDCYCTTVTARDTGRDDLGLSSMIVDSSTNFDFAPDPKFAPGSGVIRSSYQICVIDPTKPGYVATSSYDLAGNHTSVITRYATHFALLTPGFSSFGAVAVGSKQVLYDTISNPGSTDIALTSLKLTNDSLGFAIDSLDRSVLKAGQRRILKLSFSPRTTNEAYDTLSFAAGCPAATSWMVGNGGMRDFIVTNHDFGCIYVGDTLIDSSALLLNLSANQLKIDSIWSDDARHFKYAGSLPLRLPGSAQSVAQLRWKFTPDSLNVRYATAAHYRDTSGLVRSDSLFGCATSKLAVSEGTNPNTPTNQASLEWLSRKDNSALLLLPARPNPVRNGRDVTLTIGLRQESQVSVKLFDMLGRERAVLFQEAHHPEGLFDVHFNTTQLSTGTYFYRLEASGEVRSGRLVIE